MNLNEMTKMIFKDEKGKYTIGVSNKKQDGTYENAYFPIQFKAGVEVENKTLLKITNAFITFYKWEHEDKKGTTFFIKCLDFEVIDNENPIKKVDPVENVKNGNYNPFKEFGDSIQIDDDALPF